MTKTANCICQLIPVEDLVSSTGSFRLARYAVVIRGVRQCK